ncbi:hypothetical protein FACS1894158_00510 [Betaproteobacteria bacterium]|nr:hypothetical protein FACS1894158_00510 [Betaproteobacteria bacterium]
MARIAQCPSCGAAISFRSVVSVLAVCEYCRTTLLDRNGEIENLGKMAALVEDRSPLRLGAEGRWNKKHFTVIGRLQLKYEQGMWSEWFLLFDKGRTGWLSEASGEYALFFPKAAAVPLPTFSELAPGDVLTLEATPESKPDEWIVTDIERFAECVAGEGELPFKVGSGYPAPTVDLRANGSRMATLDYSEGEDKPLLFVGETVDFSSLAWTNLREDTPFPIGPKTQAKALRCAKCGAPLEIRHEGILAVGCVQCGAITDAETQKLLSALESAQKLRPKIPLGAKGKLQGEKLEVIGFMQRQMTVDRVRYDWREYLLARVDKPGYRWLTEYDGHWNVADVIGGPGKNITYQGKTFRHFQTYTARVNFVIGEFTWRVKIGEEARLTDYIAPPQMLCNEQTDKEISWSLSEYIAPDEIAKAFGLKAALPKPIGVYANQPSPWKARSVGKIPLFFFALALALQFALRAGFSSTEYLREQIPPLREQVKNPQQIPGNLNALQAREYLQSRKQALEALPKEQEAWISSPFTLTQPVSLRVISEASGLDNSWVELGLGLVNEQNGEARAGSVELSYYSGRDSDGAWVENDRRQTLVFRDLPAGTWHLMVEQSLDPQAVKAGKFPGISLSISKVPPPWSNLVIFALALLLWPLFILWRAHSFEARRWEESDLDGDDDE